MAEIYSPRPGRAEKLKDVMLDAGGRRRTAQVERVWHHDGRPILKFSGIDSIGDAELWTGADVLVDEADRMIPGDGEYSHRDLIGCRVVADAPLGVVAGVEDYGGTPLLRVATSQGREVLVPFARAICREIDIKEKIIRVDLPEGLLDL